MLQTRNITLSSFGPDSLKQQTAGFFGQYERRTQKMLAKILVLVFGLIALASSRSIHRYELGERYYQLKARKQQEAANRFRNYYKPADDYNFGYSVNDQYTGDIKSHKESRKNGIVKGSYELVDPDGYKRIVDYTADDYNGFNAFVRRIPYPQPIGQFGVTYGTSAPPYATAAPFTPFLGTSAPPTHRFGPNFSKVLPAVNNDINNYVSDFFNGYSEASFDPYY